jgi:hypothetical protein
MRHATTLLALLALTALPASAQIAVPPGAAGALETAVNANTTPGQVFVLQAGQTYPLVGRMQPTVDVVIRADGGDCPVVISDCPLIQPVAAERVMAVQTADVTVTLEQVAATNVNPSGQSDARMFRAQADGVTFRFDRVLLYDEPDMVVRFDNEDGSVFMDASIVKDIGDPNGTPDLGRFVDDRGNDMDTLSIVNSTFYSINSRITRDGGGDLDFFRFEHNTVHFAGQYVIDVGDTDGDVIIRNNLMIDTGFRGAVASDDPVPQIRLDEVGGEAFVSHNSHVLDAALLESPVAPVLYNGIADSTVTADGNDDNARLSFRPAFADAQPAFMDFTGEPYDYSYPEGEDAFDASSAGQPLGALVWFGLEIEAPRVAVVRDVANAAELDAALAEAGDGSVITLTTAGTYALSGIVRNTGSLTLQAAGGLETRPTITLAQSVEDPLIRPEADFTLRGINVVGGNNAEEVLRVRDTDDDDDVRIVIEDADLSGSLGGEDLVRISSPVELLRLNRVRLFDSGRSIVQVRDDADVDSLIVTSSTLFDSQDRLRIRDENDVDYLLVDGVTFYNVGNGDSQMLDLQGDSTRYEEIVIRNSLFVATDEQEAIDIPTGLADEGATASISNTVVFTQAEDPFGGAAADLFASGAGNLMRDPGLRDPENGDFAVNANSVVATAASDGGPVGDPRNGTYQGTSVVGPAQIDGLSISPMTPNPASDASVLTVTLGAAADLRAEVYDLLGRRVALLADGPTAAGATTLAVDAGALPSGTYLVRVASQGRTLTAALTVTR